MNSKNVYINCPFDNQFYPLLKSLLFTIIYLDLNPIISETSDSATNRLDNIKSLMSKSKYSIHDLSRIELLNEGDAPRFNMPFECGIDFGIIYSNALLDKRLLILEKEQFCLQKVMSDIAGNDIKAHNNDPEKLIKAVRDWFQPNLRKIPLYPEIWYSYCEFDFYFKDFLKDNKLDYGKIFSITLGDVIEIIIEWMKKKNIRKNV